MATLARKKVTVQYRKLDDLAGAFGTKTLQEALSSCLNQRHGGGTVGDDPECRQFSSDSAYGTIVLNTFEDKEAFFFGELVRYEPGANLPLLQIGSGAKAYNLTQAKAPDGHEPIRGTLYFMSIKSHVVLIESDVSAARAERYISWLLSEQTSVLAKGTHVILLAELSAMDGAMQLSQVEQIVVKPRPISANEKQATLDVPATTVRSREVAETNTWEVLKAAGMDDTDIQRLADQDTQLEVTLQIKFKAQRHKKQLSIDDTNRLLRNLPEDELTLIGPGGRQKNGKIEKLAYPANVELVGTLFNSNDVARALYEGYKHFVTNGYIDG